LLALMLSGSKTEGRYGASVPRRCGTTPPYCSIPRPPRAALPLVPHLRESEQQPPEDPVQGLLAVLV